MHTNRLIHASSPYLLQHAHNPVDWYEWGDEAFAKARSEDKLVLISIGYSACHWCHVMERECFEQEDTAAIMNKHFVCIKVDREERPDIDQIYMDAVQLLTGRGGWPLNCFALPDGRPLHGGTYFPKQEWERVLTSLAGFYQSKKEEALQFATELTQGIRKQRLVEAPASALLSKQELAAILQEWQTRFDTNLGGYTWAPKFPMPHNWECFLQYGQTAGDMRFIAATHITLQRMAEGGIYDQLGGGFARYSTDSFWKVPHFEKMLYDNAQLMGLYAKAYQHEPLQVYKDVIEQTHQFIAQELTDMEGLFYSALDADSEGVEGKYYVWTQQELADILGTDEPLFSLYYSVDRHGNWEEGVNILYRTRSMADVMQLTGKTAPEIEATIARCRQQLMAVRAKRIPPGLDTKCITAWNALMIKGYAEASEALGNPAYLQIGKTTADIILEHLWKDDRLYRIYKDGKVSVHGFAEDYALLAEALIALYEAGANENYLHVARLIVQSAIRQFYVEETGLFAFTSTEDAPLVTRKTDTADDVIPCANSVLAKVLWKLGYYFHDTTYHAMTDRMLLSAQPGFARVTSSFTNWIQVLIWRQYGFRQVIVTGPEALAFKRSLQQHYIPNAIVVALSKPTNLPLFADKQPTQQTRIFVCTDQTCSLPQSTVEDALSLLLDEF